MKYNKIIFLSLMIFFVIAPNKVQATDNYTCFTWNWRRETGNSDAYYYDGPYCVHNSDPQSSTVRSACETYAAQKSYYNSSSVFASYLEGITNTGTGDAGYSISTQTVDLGTKYAGPIPNGEVCQGVWEAVPTISGTNNIVVGSPTANSVTSTDVSKTSTKYELDWDGNGTPDGSTLFGVGGVPTPIGNTYSTPGTYQVRARILYPAQINWQGVFMYQYVSAWSVPFQIVVSPSSFNCEASQFNPVLNIINTVAAVFRRLDPGQRIFNSNITNKCYVNNSAVSYFIPMNSTAEINAFNANMPSGVTKANGAW